jgi:hypothetical protein
MGLNELQEALADKRPDLRRRPVRGRLAAKAIGGLLKQRIMKAAGDGDG